MGVNGTAMVTRAVGETGLELTELGFGGGGLGDLFVKVPDPHCDLTLDASWRGGVRFFDTAPYYGAGLSELRLGRFLRSGPRADFVVSTKVGRVLRRSADPAYAGDPFWTGGLAFEQAWDYSYDGVMRSFEDSLQRLGLTSVDVLVIHDLDALHHDADALTGHWHVLESSGVRALEELRASGAVRAIAAGINRVEDIPRFLETCELDLMFVAGRYTLLDQAALPEALPLCERHGVGIVVAAVFNSGILATGPLPGAKYDYRDAPREVLERAGRLQAVCRRHGVPLRAAALQFPLAHPAVRSVLSGPVEPDEARDSASAHATAIPPDLWEELCAEGLIPSDAPVPAPEPARWAG